MLILTRRLDEVVIIGEDDKSVRIKIVDIERDKVRLGFEAPKTVQINREEVYNRNKNKKP